MRWLRTVAGIGIITACLFMGARGATVSIVVADNVTPGMPTVLVETPLLMPTEVMVTAEEAPPTPLPPAVSREVSTPIATVPAEVATEAPLPTQPPAATEPPLPTPTSTKVPTPLPTDTATSQPLPSPEMVPTLPLPSPADLRRDAKLRWGNGIPSSVRRWAYLIVPAARRYHLDPNLIAAVMTMESNGDPLAWSGADARGLMQILHGPWDPRENVNRGAEMLASLFQEFGRWDFALAGYNAGPGAVQAYGGVPPYRDTQDYVVIVLYLSDLFGHHHLTSHRKAQYSHSLSDLRRFSDQRHKIARLAALAHVEEDNFMSCVRIVPGCGGESITRAPRPVFNFDDAFWLLAGTPDPLQHVTPSTEQR
jgi:hypothetical protein